MRYPVVKPSDDSRLAVTVYWAYALRAHAISVAALGIVGGAVRDDARCGCQSVRSIQLIVQVDKRNGTSFISPMGTSPPPTFTALSAPTKTRTLRLT